MVHHHSPQSSLFIRQNLSPGPGFKMKERNSMFDTNNKVTVANSNVNGGADLGGSSSKYILISDGCENANKSS
jgi:hypothetical protein